MSNALATAAPRLSLKVSDLGRVLASSCVKVPAMMLKVATIGPTVTAMK
jgi:hypothetical protein